MTLVGFKKVPLLFAFSHLPVILKNGECEAAPQSSPPTPIDGLT